MIAYGETAAKELAGLTGGEFDVDSLKVRESELLVQLGVQAERLSGARKIAAQLMERGVESIIAELNMGRSLFAVSFETRPSESDSINWRQRANRV